MPRLGDVRSLSTCVLEHMYRRADWIDYGAPAAVSTRAAALLLEARAVLHTENKAHGAAVVDLLDRCLATPPGQAKAALFPDHADLLLALARHIRALVAEPARTPGDWENTRVSQVSEGVPTMLTHETRRFYTWLGERLSPKAQVVEFGAWLGSSTLCLCEGLSRSAQAQQSVHVYDSFIWAPWMDQHIARFPGDDLPAPGESFVHLFHQALVEHRRRIIVHPDWIDDGVTPGLSPQWTGPAPIELLIYDMGPDRAVLDAIWDGFSPFFQKEKTILVFNEYGKISSSELWDFCDLHRHVLRPQYKPMGSSKAFLYV